MRGTVIFICGVLVGILFELDIADSDMSGIKMLNHVGITVDDIDESVAFYTETMGFEKMFSLSNDKGQTTVAYIEVGENTFLELNRSRGNRPAGFTHFGIQVEGMESVLAMYQSRGAKPTAPRRGGSQAILSYIVDPQGVPIELAEYPENWVENMALASE